MPSSEHFRGPFDRMSTVTAPAGVVDSTASALENQLGSADWIVDEEALANSIERFRQQSITLPTRTAIELSGAVSNRCAYPANALCVSAECSIGAHRSQ